VLNKNLSLFTKEGFTGYAGGVGGVIGFAHNRLGFYFLMVVKLMFKSSCKW